MCVPLPRGRYRMGVIGTRRRCQHPPIPSVGLNAGGHDGCDHGCDVHDFRDRDRDGAYRRRSSARLTGRRVWRIRDRADLFGPAFAAHMAVEADDAVAFGHDHVEIVAHHQDAAAMAAADPGDQFIELRLADEIDGLHRLVKHQKFGLAQQARGPEARAAIRRRTARRRWRPSDAQCRSRPAPHRYPLALACSVSDSSRWTSSGTLGVSGKRCGT